LQGVLGLYGREDPADEENTLILQLLTRTLYG
jgi:hypothetical protein